MLHAHPQRRHIATVVLLAAAALVVLGELTVWIPVAGPLARTYGRTSAATAGWVFGLAMALGVLVTGPLADRYGRRPVVLAGLVALAAASLAAGAAPTWPVHLTARAAQGLAAATFPPVALAWVAEAVPTARQALAVTVVVTAMQAANPVGQLYGQWVTAAGGWRATYLSLAAAYLLAAVGLRPRLTGTPAAMRRERAGQTARQLLGILRVRPLLACWLLSGLAPGVVVAMYAGLQLHLADVASAPTDLLVAARAAGLAGILAGPLLLWRALAGLPSSLQALVGVGVTTAGLVGQVLAPGPRALVAGNLLVAAGLPVTMAPLASVIAQYAPTALASAYAVQSTAIYVGVSVGAVAAARLGYAALCLAAAAALAVGVVPLLLTVPARVPASHGAWVARPHRWTWAVWVVGAMAVVALLGLDGRDGCWLGCNRQGGIAQTRPGSTAGSAGAAGTLGVPGAGASGSSRAAGTGGATGTSAIPTTAHVGTGAESTVANTPLTVPPTTGAPGASTAPASTRAFRSTTTRPGSSSTTTTKPSSTTQPPTTVTTTTTAEPSSTAPTTTTLPTTTVTTTATTAPSSAALPTSSTGTA